MTALIATGCTAVPADGKPVRTAAAASRAADLSARGGSDPTHPYVGMWITEDGYIRHELMPDGRYDEARGTRESAYTGRYVVTGTHIDYVDDTGFTADGEFVGLDVLHHGGYVFYRAGAKGRT